MRKVNKPKKRTATKRAVESPTLVSNERVNDPFAETKHAAANDGGFDFQSESEPKALSTFAQATDNASQIAEKWKDRLANEGKIYYACPFCKGKEVAFHDKSPKKAKKACQTHIGKEHAMSLKAAKLTKTPKAMYQPMERVESPKRTLADAVAPKYRAQVEAQLRHAKMLEPIRNQAKNLQLAGDPVVKLTTMTESLAIQQLGKLTDQQLVAVFRMARDRGKRQLSRAATKICLQKNLNVHAIAQPSARAKAIQEALMNQAFASR